MTTDVERRLREANAEISYLKECIEKAVTVTRNDKMRAQARLNFVTQILMTAWRGKQVSLRGFER